MHGLLNKMTQVQLFEKTFSTIFCYFIDYPSIYSIFFTCNVIVIEVISKKIKELTGEEYKINKTRGYRRKGIPCQCKCSSYSKCCATTISNFSMIVNELVFAF